MYLLFLDFEQAFDSVDRNFLWKVLQDRKVPAKIINLIKEAYNGYNCRVIHRNNVSDNFLVTTGVKQGCILSPILFTATLDYIMNKAISSRRGIQWGLEGRLEDLDYADDICLLSHNHADMQSKVDSIMEIAAKAGLRINISKSHVLRIGTQNNIPLHVNGKNFGEVEQVCYLGSILDKSGGTDADIAARISKASQSFGMLRHLWASKNLHLKTKLRIYNTNVKSILLYGSETWKQTRTTEHQLQTFVNKCLRSIMCYKWPDHISNQQLWNVTGQEPIITTITRRKWNWIAHTLRKPEQDVTRQALDWNPQGARRRGRPKHTWKRTVINEADSQNMSWKQIKVLSKNRVRFKAFLEALCSDRS